MVQSDQPGPHECLLRHHQGKIMFLLSFKVGTKPFTLLIMLFICHLHFEAIFKIHNPNANSTLGALYSTKAVMVLHLILCQVHLCFI